jgi:hypothetical protein
MSKEKAEFLHHDELSLGLMSN